MKITHSTKVNSNQKVSAAADIKPNGGDMINYIMVYTGPGYEKNTPEAVLEWGKNQGFDKMFWGSDEAYKMNGIYNGDTYILYKDANKLPAGYKEDALEAESTNRVMSATEIEGSSAEEIQKRIEEYQKMNAELGKQLDDLQNDQLNKFNKAQAQQPKKKGLFRRAFGASQEDPNLRCHKVREDADSVEYVVSSEKIESTTQWMGRYLTPKGDIRHVYFDFETDDWNEAADEFESVILEPYQSCKLLGRAPANIANDETFSHIECATRSDTTQLMKELEDKLSTATHRYMVDVGGFDEEDDPNDKYSMGADHFWRIDVKETKSDDGRRGIYIEVRAELGYESTEELLDQLNVIVKQYDKEAYFEPYDPGISVCYIWEDNVSASTSIMGAYPDPVTTTRDKWLESNDINEVEDIEDQVQEISIEFDTYIDIADDGSYEYVNEDGTEDTKYDWAKDSTYSGDWYVDVDELVDKVILRTPGEVIEDLDQLLLYSLPNITGVHEISGVANLTYNVSGLVRDVDGVYDGDVNVTFDRDSSGIRRFKIDGEPVNRT